MLSDPQFFPRVYFRARLECSYSYDQNVKNRYFRITMKRSIESLGHNVTRLDTSCVFPLRTKGKICPIFFTPDRFDCILQILNMLKYIPKTVSVTGMFLFLSFRKFVSSLENYVVFTVLIELPPQPVHFDICRLLLNHECRLLLSLLTRESFGVRNQR